MNPSEGVSPTISLAIFASGGGSNADKIARHLQEVDGLKVALMVSNKAEAGVKRVAEKYEIPFVHFSNDQFDEGQKVLQVLQEEKIFGIVLAGFLRKIPSPLLDTFPDRILNIHPALLPKYGGKGMYGNYVHQAVFDAGEKISGPTIHVVNHNYDEGRILFQAEVGIEDCKTPEDVAAKVLSMEHKYYPKVVEAYFVNRGWEEVK